MIPAGKQNQSKENRENPSRAIYIRREIDYSLFKELLPEIINLRGQNNDPICVYLDSNGGDVFFANLLTDLIRCPNQDGQSCKMITVAVGFVASSAADWLALGDYAIAYPFSQIHYHGTRQRDDEITLQKIPNLAASLRATNEQYAFRLASRMFRRMVFHIMIIAEQKIDQPGIIGPVELFEASKIEVFIKFLREKLKSQGQLLTNTTAKQEKFRQLVASLRASDGIAMGIDTKNQKILFTHLLELELSANPTADIVNLLPVIEEDYAQVRDFFYGQYQRNLKGIIANSGPIFLDPAELPKLSEAEALGKKEKLEFLVKTVSPRLEPLWFFVVSLCRALQEGEYPMNPEEAYWCGLVDEDVGKKLPCVRAVVEKINASSIEPLPLAAQSAPSVGQTKPMP